MLIDSHCHLDFPNFDGERDTLVSSAKELGIGHMVTISTRVRQFDRICAIAEAYDAVSCSVGTHPHNAGEEKGITTQELVDLAEHPKVVAIGEAGLDYHYDNAPRDDQAAGFRAHIIAARKTGLPLIIHARSADEDVGDILEEAHERDGPFPMVLHCFSSGEELARRGIALGAYLSFSGILSFKKADALRAIAARVPEDRLLVETDAPYLAPVPHRGKRNEPAYVRHTAQVLADVRGMELGKLADITTANFERLFTRAKLS
ncbi:MAG: TatD family hydrolase [Pseudomonadota bacterium]